MDACRQHARELIGRHVCELWVGAAREAVQLLCLFQIRSPLAEPGVQDERARLADERQKLLQAFYANAIPLELLKAEQDRISREEQAARSELDVTEADLEGWKDVLSVAILLAGNCHAAYLKARPFVRRRFNEAVLEAAYVKGRKIARAEFSEVFAPLLSRPSSNKRLKVDPRGFEPLTSWLPAKRSTS